LDSFFSNGIPLFRGSTLPLLIEILISAVLTKKVVLVLAIIVQLKGIYLQLKEFFSPNEI
jgi:hypothetical protein